MKQSLLKFKLNQIFLKNKLSKNHSEICSNYLIKAEVLKAKGHGLARLKMYCDRLRAKVINPKPKIKIKKISNSISFIDANNSIGFVAADTAIKTLIKNTKKTGIGLVGVKNSGHYGLSGYYVEQAVKKNLMVWCFTNAPPAITPYGAKKTLFGTNPICFGTPSGGKVPFILDTSVSMINRGIIRVAARLGKNIPAGVALDKNGNPTINAKKALEGVQLPIGGFRGSGLAWMVDILSGVMTGAGHGGKVRDPFDDFRGPQNVGHLFLAIKPNIFIGKNYIKRIKENIKIIKKLPRVKGFASISYPGENKAKRFSKNSKKKINLPKEIEKDLEKLISSSS
mgnify:CR=1 FL=1